MRFSSESSGECTDATSATSTDYVAIDYSTAGEWTITDSHGRTQKILFDSGMVDRVELSAFGDVSATYTLEHTGTEIRRQRCLSLSRSQASMSSFVSPCLSAAAVALLAID